MDFYEPAIIQDLKIPIYDSDPPSQSLNSPGLLWYNTTIGLLRFTSEVVDYDGTYCIKTICDPTF